MLSLNSHYIVLFKNARDATQVAHLARQMYPGKSVILYRRVQKMERMLHTGIYCAI